MGMDNLKIGWIYNTTVYSRETDKNLMLLTHIEDIRRTALA